MKLDSEPTLTVTEGRVPNALPTDTRIAVYFDVEYSYSSSNEEVTFLQNQNLLILERVYILGYDPSDPSHDLDLRFSIRNQFDVRPPDLAEPGDLKSSGFKISRKRTPYVLKDDLVKALNSNGLSLSSVRAMVQFSYVHIGYSKAQKAI
jgi:hypothetical protein